MLKRLAIDTCVMEKVLTGELHDWVAADPESVAIHLGVDATYAVQSSIGHGVAGSSYRSHLAPENFDVNSWPKDICWLFNYHLLPAKS